MQVAVNINGLKRKGMTMKNTAKNTVVTISKIEAKELIHSIPNGLIFSMEYIYKHPYCADCGHKSVKFKRGLEVCPKCGGKVKFNRVTLAQKGVCNPANCTKPGHGVFDGMSAKEAEEKYNLFKHFDRNAKNDDGTRGCYRNASFDNITRLKVNGVKYIVE